MSAPPKAGRYALLDEIGHGSMGVVYRAHDPVIGRTVAVKTVRLDEQAAGMPHAELLHRFQTEARAAGQLSHPNIVVVYDAGEDDGLFYITMELVEGRSLQYLMDKRAAFPLPRVVRVMQQACSALDFAHQHKVVHRDIKPANLMLTPDDTLKITDFGTAKILKYGTVQTAQVIGTPSYMSPEQVKGRLVDGRSDIFSLGVVLYELVTGEKPFPGESVTTVIYKIVNEDPIPPRELDSAIPAGLSAVISRALAKAPISRFQTGREFMEALQNYRDFVGSAAAPVRHALTAKAAPFSRGASSAPAGAISTGRRSPLLAAAPPPKQTGSVWIALVLLAVIGGAGYRVWPALQEIWQRGVAERNAERAAAQNSRLASGPVAAVPVAAVAQPEPPPAQPAAPAPPEGPSTLAAPLAAKPAPAEAAAKTPQLTTTKAPSPSSAPPPTPVAPRQTSAADSAPAKNPVAPAQNIRPPQRTRLLPTPAAALWQRKIEEVLVEAGVSEKVQVTAVGNSVTLTGKLSPKAHGALVSWLQRAPARIQVIDDIEYSEDPAPSPVTGNAVPF